MHNTIRKYCSTMVLILISIVSICFIVDQFNDSQHLAKQTAMTLSMMVEDNDIDVDDDDKDDVATQSLHPEVSPTHILSAINIKKITESKCPMALLRGQVRRYSPRNSLADSYNYTLLSALYSGVVSNHATFFCHPKHYATTLKSDRSADNSLQWPRQYGSAPSRQAKGQSTRKETTYLLTLNTLPNEKTNHFECGPSCRDESSFMPERREASN